uniref:Sex hormone-binding globulin n=1 Tax=Myripristis murdjan TaxID=586833 RepID=A0A668A8X6_9TELE
MGRSVLLSCEPHEPRVLKKQISGRTPVNLGQERDIWKPLVQSTTNLSEVHSIRSVFEFRTFDPEGAIFYGDTKDGEDWFMLSLKDGIPEMQISKEGTIVSVAGGPKLNDGKWHLLELSNQGKFVILEVDRAKALVVGLGSNGADDLLSGQIRLALGGVLIDTKKMIVQFQPQMDGCVQEGSWLNLTAPWETEAEELWPCYQNIQPGSYFPGTGFAVFNTSVFSRDAEQDGLKIEIWGHFSQMDGTILSMKAPGQELLLALEADNNTKAVTLTFGNDKIMMAEDFNRLALIFQKDLLEVLMENDQSEARRLSVASEEQPAYLGTLAGGRLAIGGLLGEGEEHVGSHYLTGCLQKIQVQGKDLDLDLAVKHASVSSYSCPAEIMKGHID